MILCLVRPRCIFIALLFCPFLWQCQKEPISPAEKAMLFQISDMFQFGLKFPFNTQKYEKIVKQHLFGKIVITYHFRSPSDYSPFTEVKCTILQTGAPARELMAAVKNREAIAFFSGKKNLKRVARNDLFSHGTYSQLFEFQDGRGLPLGNVLIVAMDGKRYTLMTRGMHITSKYIWADVMTPKLSALAGLQAL